MSSFPLTPAGDAALNCATPPTDKRYGVYDVNMITKTTSAEPSNEAATNDSEEDVTSSPLISNVSEVTSASLVNQENNSLPAKPQLRHERRKSRVISGAELSPLKILNRKRSGSPSGSQEGSMGPPPLRCARRLSPEKRFPVKTSGSYGEEVRKVSMEDMVRRNAALKYAIDIFEDDEDKEEEEEEEEQRRKQQNQGSGSAEEAKDSEGDEAAGPDDTMMSTFSTFSAVPGMTIHSRLGQSPVKMPMSSGYTPRGPATGSRPPTRDDGASNTSNLLMDFMESARFPHRSPDKKGNQSVSQTTGNVNETPNRRNTANLIDFEIPPMPTPRSVPTITARELESLKSGFLSEISSLKASLSGKEAEVQSLKTAVGDAEKRVGESMEQLREETLLKDQMSAEKDDWERRSREMETVMRQAKDDIATSHSEREELEFKLDESEKRREAAETLHQDAESKIAGMRAGKDCESSGDGRKSPGSSNKEVEMAVERVARELHTLYKGKHETKVAALKKSYESRWEKKVRELENRVQKLRDENSELQNRGGQAAAALKSVDNSENEARKAQAVRDSAKIKELNANVERLEAVLASVQKDSEELRGMLEKERVEKGELVQLAEEMMSMQSVVGASQKAKPAPTPARATPSRPTPARATPARAGGAPTPSAAALARDPGVAKSPAKTPRRSVDSYSYRHSAGRASGLRAPGSALRQPTDRKSIGAPVMPRPGRTSTGTSGQRTSMMSNIERMGHRG